jgi:hypothetical protein
MYTKKHPNPGELDNFDVECVKVLNYILEIEPDLEINAIVCDAIEIGLYQELQREIYKIKQKKDRRLKELTIYIRAFNEITNEENYITKSGQIF